MSSTIRNPVLATNPWLTSANNVFRSKYSGGNKLLKSGKIMKNRCRPKQLQTEVRKVKKLTKAVITKLYTEQLVPLYPYLTKSKIRAALIMSDNNLHEARLLLDYKNKLSSLRKYIAVQSAKNIFYKFPRNFKQTARSNFTGSFSLTKTEESLFIQKNSTSSTTNTIITSSSNANSPVNSNENEKTPHTQVSFQLEQIKSEEKYRNSNVMSSKITAKLHSILEDKNVSKNVSLSVDQKNSSSNMFLLEKIKENNSTEVTFTEKNSSSSEYDFTECDSKIETTKKWFEERRLDRMCIKNTVRKVGIIIKKNSTGYEASPL
ncbi:unnamed protein product [Psylliodes chrysocephalus]|uniref:Uncharacterized protein n=1 Tax=Psylliodes chrysocephalus TaxID=3402493 RepID=A0A9P0DBN3_9CUCU|nr:unnamed protein product [Psylliodes chrysocephala]